MTASTRFLGFAVLAWAGVRAVSLGIIPWSDAASGMVQPAAGPIASPAATQFGPLEPVVSPPQLGQQAYEQMAYDPAPYAANSQPGYASRLQRVVYVGPPAYPYPYVAARQSRARIRYIRDDGPSYASDGLMPEPRRLPFTGEPTVPPEPPIQLASVVRHGAPIPDFVADPTAPALVHKSNRLELSSWAMMRGKPGDILGANSLSASGGTLGGSQAGARVTYWATPHLAASLRVASPIGGARGGEAGIGVRFRPWLSVPFALTAERRQRFGRSGGRSDFAFFAEGGLWDRPMPLGLRLDAYAQAGVVGIKSHDLFGDGAFTLTRPIWRNISAGFGVWGGAQPHLYRLDAGPRLTIAMRRGIRIHADYRQRLRGTAFPSSGPAVTIAGDF